MVVMRSLIFRFRQQAPGRSSRDQPGQWLGQCAHRAALIRETMRDATRNAIPMLQTIPGTARRRGMTYIRVHLAASIRGTTLDEMHSEMWTQLIIR